MNQFAERFREPIKQFWEIVPEEQKQLLLADILLYANENPASFKKELKEVQFDFELQPLPLVLEALSKETDKWGAFYVDTLDTIFEQAKISDNPKQILSYLMEFYFIMNDSSSFVQQIVDRLNKETDSDFLPAKLAAISSLPAYLKNPIIHNGYSITNSLQQKLYDKNWKVRYITYQALGFENMLPSGFKLSMFDRIRKLILGVPSISY